MSQIAVLHPGEMGAAIGRDLLDLGHDVCWLPAGRSAETRQRADQAGLRAASGVAGCDLVVSICPPAAALDNARSLGAFGGIFLDANAISPRTAADVAGVVRELGATYVDGGVIGSPPTQAGTTRLYLSGDGAPDAAAAFAGARIEAQVLTSSEFAASSLKMVYAAWTKISAALLLATRGAAAELGVDASLAAEWARSQPALERRYEAALASAASKGWRWEDEMRQIATTFLDAGEPQQFGLAAADIFAHYPRPLP